MRRVLIGLTLLSCLVFGSGAVFAEDARSRWTPEVRPYDSLAGLADTIAAYLEGSAGVEGIAVYQRGVPVLKVNADTYMALANDSRLYVLVAFLDAVGQNGRAITADESAMLDAMITRADGNAIDYFWYAIGGIDGVQYFLYSHGLPYLGSWASDWASLMTTPSDLGALLDRLYAGTLLARDDTVRVLDLMQRVVADQRWGIPAGLDPAKRAAVFIQDGWFSSPVGWGLTSVGIVQPCGGDVYTIAVMTDFQPGFEYAREAIEVVASLVNLTMQAQMGPACATVTATSGSVSFIDPRAGGSGLWNGGALSVGSLGLGTEYDWTLWYEDASAAGGGGGGGGGCHVDCNPGCQVDCNPGCQLDCNPGCQVDCEPGCQVDCEPGGGDVGGIHYTSNIPCVVDTSAWPAIKLTCSNR